jgi:hypothetical protein
LNPQRANRWTPFRMPTRDVAKAFQAELKRHTARAAA